jgi:hypothetical protein
VCRSNNVCQYYCGARLQFLKLGAAGALPGLSEYFLIWDMDMVPLRPLPLLTPLPDAADVALTGGSAYQVPHKSDTASQEDLQL